ncbi:MAG TPA: exopolysaccharide biosynthesis polyprenyl glycosylphosphotransferase [Planctomycetota bacterium]|nr:exopolysaccharide biosynthesis polyprenyl glycosylphosphotransferase [Planctomycetota bacterium]
MIAHSHRLSLRLTMSLADLVVVVGSLALAIALYRLAGDAVVEREFALLALTLTPTTAIIFHLGGAYDSLRLGRVQVLCARSIWCFFIVLCLFLATAYMLKVSAQFSRAVIGGWVGLSTIGLVGVRLAVHASTAWRRRRGLDLEATLLVGPRRSCAAQARHFARHPDLGIRVAAIAGDVAPGETMVAGDGLPTGGLDDLAALVREHGIVRVVVCGDLAAQDLVMRVVNALIRHPVTVQYAPDLSSFPIFGLRIVDFGGQPMLNLSASPLSESALLVKWIEDKVLSALFLLVSCPLLLAIAAAIKLTSPGPAMFVQERHGRGGRVIRVLKFRTMHHAPLPVASPAQAREAVMASAAATVAEAPVRRAFGDARPDDFIQATRADPRVTRLGGLLRRLSLDELPQFINVLKGDMSLVGPRPHALRHNDQYALSIHDLMRRHYVKPGITGLAQVNGARGETRSLSDMQRRVGYDLEYIQNWSLWLDLKILALTAVRGFYNDQP